MKLVENYRGRFIGLDIVAGYMYEDIRAHEEKYNEPFGPDMGIW